MDKTPEDNIKLADELVRGIWASLDDPESLSRLILQLSVLYAGLGNYLTEAKDAERTAENKYKMCVESNKLHYVGMGDSATVAESRARVEAQELLAAQHVANKRVDILKFKREDVEKIIDATRSRLSLIKSDIRNS